MDFVVVAPGQNDILLNNNNHKLGDWEPIKNIDDPYVQEMGRFAVMEHAHNLLGANWRFICVVRGETQLVAEGKKFRLVVEVEITIVVPGMPKKIEFFMATVLDKQCDRSWKLLSFESLPIRS